MESYKNKEKGGILNYKAVKLMLVGPPQVGKTTTKDRLLGVIDSLERHPDYKKASTCLEKPTEICLDDVVYAKKDATIINSSSNSAWNIKTIEELAQHLLKYLERRAAQANEEGSKKLKSWHRKINELSTAKIIEGEIQNIEQVVSFEETDQYIRSVYSEHWKEELIAHLEHSTTAYLIDSGGQPEFLDILLDIL